MLNVLSKTYILVVLAGLIVVSWQFDMTFVKTVFTGVFPPESMERIALIAACVFVASRILIYWFLARKNRPIVLILAAILLLIISFIASIALIGKSLTNANLEQAVQAEQQKINTAYNVQIRGLNKQKEIELADIVTATNNKRAAVKEDFTIKLKPFDDRVAFEETRVFKKGPNKDSPYGDGHKDATDARDVIASQQEDELKSIRDESANNQSQIRDYYAAKVSALKKSQATDVQKIDIDSIAKTDAADSEYVLAIKTVIAQATPYVLTSSAIITFLSLLFSLLLEVLTYAIPTVYRLVNESSNEPKPPTPPQLDKQEVNTQDTSNALNVEPCAV